MSVILDYLIGIILSVVGMLLQWITGIAYHIVGLKADEEAAKSVMALTGEDVKTKLLGTELMTNFYKSFPVLAEVFRTFALVAQLIVVALVINGMVKSLFGPISRTAENPIILATRAAFASFLIKYSAVLSGAYLYIGSILFIEFQSVVPSTEVAESIHKLSKADTVGNILGDATVATGAAAAGLGGILLIGMGILLLFLMVSLLTSYFKLVLEIIERYITMCFLAVVSPLFVACLASASSTKFFFSWAKMMLSQAILLGFSSLWLNAINYTMVHSLDGANSSMVRTVGGLGVILFITAFIVLGSKLDQHMRTLGFTVAQGGDFGASVFGAYAITKSLTRSGINAVSKGTASRIRASAAAQEQSKIRAKTGDFTGAGTQTGSKAEKTAQENLGMSKNINPSGGGGGDGGNGGSDGPVNLLTGENDEILGQTIDGKDGTTAGIGSYNDKEGIDVSTSDDPDAPKLYASNGKVTEGVTGSRETNSSADAMEDFSDKATGKSDIVSTSGMDDIITGEKDVDPLLDGADLREKIKNTPLAPGESLVALNSDLNKDGAHDIEGVYNLGADSLDGKGHLKTFDYDENTGDFIENKEGTGEYFKTKEGSFVSFDEAAAPGLMAVTPPDKDIPPNNIPPINMPEYNLVNDSTIQGDGLDASQARESLSSRTFSEGDTITAADINESELGHEVLGSYEIGANSIDQDGHLMTFDYDESTCQYTFNKDGNGEFFMDRNGDAVSFADISEGGMIAVGQATERAFFEDAKKEQHELASGSVISDGRGGLYEQTRDDDGTTYMSSFNAGIENGQPIETRDALERVVDSDNLQQITPTFNEFKGGETVGSMESRRALTEGMHFEFDESKLTPEQREQFQGRRFSFVDKTDRGGNAADFGVVNGRIGNISNDKMEIRDEAGKRYTVNADLVRGARAVQTVDSGNQNRTLSSGNNFGVSYTNSSGEERHLVFDKSSIRNGEIRGADKNGNFTGGKAKDGDSVKMYDVNQRKDVLVPYSEIKNAKVGNYDYEYKGMKVTKDGEVRASDISQIKNHGRYQEIHMKDGSVGRRTDSRFIDKDKLGKSQDRGFAYNTGSNNLGRGTEKFQVHERGQYEGVFHGKPSVTPGFKDYNATESRRMASQISDQKFFNPQEIKHASVDNQRGISIFTDKNNEKYAVIDKVKNPNFQYDGKGPVTMGENRNSAQQVIISLGTNNNDNAIRTYLNKNMERFRSKGDEVDKNFKDAANKRYTFDRPTKQAIDKIEKLKKEIRKKKK